MPEALAVLFVGAVCVGIYVYARIQALSPANRDIRSEIDTLNREIDWLEERLEKAHREDWQSDMKQTLEERLSEARNRARSFAQR